MSSRRCEQTDGHAPERRLAAAGLADQPDDFSFRDAQVDIIDGVDDFLCDGATVRSGRCSYPVRTRQPTGVLEVTTGTRLTLGDLFAVWGRPLSRSRLVGYRARRGERIRAWVGGCPWTGSLGAIPLRRHAQIVLEGGGYVPPHATFRFPRGL